MSPEPKTSKLVLGFFLAMLRMTADLWAAMFEAGPSPRPPHTQERFSLMRRHFETPSRFPFILH
jgi:hypothetical protein